MRRAIYFLTAVLCLSAFASADLKIKTRTTVMGHSTDSTVYIKGGRERTEANYGGRGGAVTIMQCDQKRMITVAANQCIIMPMGGGGSSCPGVNRGAMARMMGRQPEAPRAGGVVTITRNSTDTGERQDMFGYKARHIKTSMTMEASPDACSKSNMKMEMDGWYADLAGFSCEDNSYQAMACSGGAEGGCHDRIVMKGGGGLALGYPLKQTTTITSPQGTFTTTTEVVELTNTSLEASLFDMPPGCRVMDMSAMMGGASGADESEPSPAPEKAAAPAAQPAAPAPAAAPAVALKAPGAIRIGVVKIKDLSGQSLPTDNILMDLQSELVRKQLEAIVLEAEAPAAAVEEEAKAKQCDYILYTVASQVKDPNSGGLSPAPKGVTLDPAKYQALTSITLYKVGKPLPELEDVPLAADAPQFAVDAVTATFPAESNRVAQQLSDDAHPKAPVKPVHTAKPATTK